MLAQKNILIVDDDPGVGELLRSALQQHGYGCERVTTGEDALALVHERPPDLILLDRVLPGVAGDEVVVRLKSDPRSRSIPVIMLTGKTEETDEIIGLGLGADDYVTKPFSTRRLLARIAAKLRERETPAAQDAALPEGPIVLDRVQNRVYVNRTPVLLTPAEHRLLATLMAARGHVLSRRQLHAAVHGHPPEAEDRSVDQQLAELRRKLGPAAVCIQAAGETGYAFFQPGM